LIVPGYPNTWFKVADVRDIPVSYGAGCYRTDALGEALMLFRLPANHPFVSQGEGDDLSEGRVVTLVENSLPSGVDPLNLKDLPLIARRAQRWCTREINQMVFVWHHDDNDKANTTTAENAADDDANNAAPPSMALPDWQIPLIPGMDQTWRFHGSVTHEIACHLQEIPENGADNAHLEYIHGDFLLSWLGKIVRHSWHGVWETQPAPQAHVAKLTLKQQVTVLGRRVPLTALDSHIDQVGPALVQLIFPTPLGKVAVIETVTPVYSTLQRAQNVLWAEVRRRMRTATRTAAMCDNAARADSSLIHLCFLFLSFFCSLLLNIPADRSPFPCQDLPDGIDRSIRA
jgi:cholesterol 7-dehydrogenase